MGDTQKPNWVCRNCFFALIKEPARAFTCDGRGVYSGESSDIGYVLTPS